VWHAAEELFLSRWSPDGDLRWEAKHSFSDESFGVFEGAIADARDNILAWFDGRGIEPAQVRVFDGTSGDMTSEQVGSLHRVSRIVSGGDSVYLIGLPEVTGPEVPEPTLTSLVLNDRYEVVDSFPVGGTEHATSAHPEGGFVIAGAANDGTDATTLRRFDSAGSELWSSTTFARVTLLDTDPRGTIYVGGYDPGDTSRMHGLAQVGGDGQVRWSAARIPIDVPPVEGLTPLTGSFFAARGGGAVEESYRNALVGGFISYLARFNEEGDVLWTRAWTELWRTGASSRDYSTHTTGIALADSGALYQLAHYSLIGREESSIYLYRWDTSD
jgi:hypothetical protein